MDKPFQPWTVYRIRHEYKLRDRYSRLRAAGMLDQCELAKRLGVAPSTIKVWRTAGLLRHHAYNDKGECLFEPPGKDAPVKFRHQGKYRGKRAASPRGALDPRLGQRGSHNSNRLPSGSVAQPNRPKS